MGANLISTDEGSQIVYLHSADTATVTNSFDSTDPLTSCSYDNINVYGARNNATGDDVFLFSGFTPVLADSFVPPGALTSGCTWVAPDFYICDRGTHKLYHLSAFTPVVKSSIAGEGGSESGMTGDGTDIFHSEWSSAKFYQHSADTAVIKDSMSPSFSFPFGCTWNGVDFFASDAFIATDRLVHFSAFTSTEANSINSPAGTPSGVTWEDYDARVGVVAGNGANAIFFGAAF